MQICLRSRIGLWEKYYYAPLDIMHYFSSDVSLQILLLNPQDSLVQRRRMVCQLCEDNERVLESILDHQQHKDTFSFIEFLLTRRMVIDFIERSDFHGILLKLECLDQQCRDVEACEAFHRQVTICTSCLILYSPYVLKYSITRYKDNGAILVLISNNYFGFQNTPLYWNLLGGSFISSVKNLVGFLHATWSHVRFFAWQRIHAK